MDIKQFLVAQIDSLSFVHKLVLSLWYVEKLTPLEIADVMEIDIFEVNKLYKEALTLVPTLH